MVEPAPQNDRLGGGLGTGMSVVTGLLLTQPMENICPALSKP